MKTLRGWIELSSEREVLVNKSLTYFDNVLKSSKKDIDALLGKAKYHEIKKQYALALEQMNQILAQHNWFTAALT